MSKPTLNIAKDAMFSMGHPRGSAQSGFSIWLGRSVVLVVEISGGGRGSAREFRGPSSGKERPPQDDSVGSSWSECGQVIHSSLGSFESRSLRLLLGRL
jgi:hypothetical protein